MSALERNSAVDSWTQETTLSFIEHFRNRPVLWDPNHAQRYNKNMKNDAWEEIAARMETSTAECKRKLVSLKASLRREKAKRMKSINEGKGPDEIYQSSWFAFEKLQFLLERKPHKKNKSQNASNRSSPVDEDSCSLFSNNNAENADGTTNLPECEDDYQLEITATETTLNTNEDNNTKSYKSLVDLLGDRMNDECLMYGFYLAAKLRKYNGGIKNHVQYKILQIFDNADRGVYDFTKKPNRKIDLGKRHHSNPSVCKRSHPTSRRRVRSKSESSFSQVSDPGNTPESHLGSIDQPDGCGMNVINSFDGINTSESASLRYNTLEPTAISTNANDFSSNQQMNSHSSIVYQGSNQLTNKPDMSRNSSTINTPLTPLGLLGFDTILHPALSRCENEPTLDQISDPNLSPNFCLTPGRHSYENHFHQAINPSSLSMLSQGYGAASLSATLPRNDANPTNDLSSHHASNLSALPNNWLESIDSDFQGESRENRAPSTSLTSEPTHEGKKRRLSPTPASNAAGQSVQLSMFDNGHPSDLYRERPYATSSSASAAVPTEELENFLAYSPSRALDAGEAFQLYNLNDRDDQTNQPENPYLRPLNAPQQRDRVVLHSQRNTHRNRTRNWLYTRPNPN